MLPQMLEAWDEAQHPRGSLGRWVRKTTGTIETEDGRYRITTYSRGGTGYSPRQRGAILRYQAKRSGTRTNPSTGKLRIVKGSAIEKLGEFDTVAAAKSAAAKHHRTKRKKK